MATKKPKSLEYTCANCGHTGTLAVFDSFGQIPCVRRLCEGNALCEKCYAPIPYEVER